MFRDMKKIYLILIFPVLILTLLNSCSKELSSINSNPNNLENPDYITLLSNTIVTEFYNNSNLAWTLGNGYNQYMFFSTSYYNQPVRYSPVTNEPYWIPMWTSARDANTLYGIGQANSNPLLMAVALTLRSYAFEQLTELWGDIPFTQALKASSGIFTPQYDSQQTVYNDPQIGIIPSLRRADSLLKANPVGLISGDMLFKSSTTSWRKFINALRLRALLRVSSKMSTASEMQSIVTDGTIMSNATESAALDLPAVSPWNFISLTERAGDYSVKYMHKTLYDVFVSTADSARISAYFAVSANTPANASFNFNNYGGLPIVVDATSAQANASSNFNTSFTNGSNKYLIKARLITYAEVQFILAEAALKGYITGNPASYYNNGVKGAFAEIGLSTTVANNYLTHANVIYNNSSTAASLNQIITQKWLVNINNGFEGWIEYRRTSYPALQAGGSANMNNGNIPARFLYPTTEAAVNATNYNNEITKMGTTETTTYKAWWEK